MPNTCYTIALTGGIASGKSAVSRFFEQLSVDVIDADVIARNVVKKNTQGLKLLVKAFGQEILHEDGSLNRSKLRQHVFNNSQQLKQLNAITHPLIYAEIKKQIQRVNKSYCMLVIPLLCESNNYDWVDRVLVVDVKEETQRQRLVSRDSISEELAVKMLKSQCTRTQRLSLADDLINNESSLKSLEARVSYLHKLYKSLS